MYDIGVHYWNDHGFGASFATVRVYIGPTLAFQATNVEMHPLDMWAVGKLHVPNAFSGGTEPPVQTCFQSGDACLAKKLPGAPKGGKMWQPSGASCITPCYQPVGLGPSVSPVSCGQSVP